MPYFGKIVHQSYRVIVYLLPKKTPQFLVQT